VNEENKSRIREFLQRAPTQGDVAATGDNLHSDMVEEVPLLWQGPGLAGRELTLAARWGVICRPALEHCRTDSRRQSTDTTGLMQQLGKLPGGPSNP
jgi:hypothetical protein